jgi:hypothetical protein
VEWFTVILVTQFEIQDAEIQPMGEGLSNGEKQAICCIRGLLRKILRLNVITVGNGSNYLSIIPTN